MRRKLNALALLAISATALFALAPASAEAQVTRQRTNAGQGWYRIPGTNSSMYPAPRYYYQINGMRIYPGRGFSNWPYSNGTTWYYGYPNGYNWSYGYPSNYVWPYGRR